MLYNNNFRKDQDELAKVRRCRNMVKRSDASEDEKRKLYNKFKRLSKLPIGGNNMMFREIKRPSERIASKFGNGNFDPDKRAEISHNSVNTQNYNPDERAEVTYNTSTKNHQD